MAFFAYHPGRPEPGSPWAARDFSQLSVPKMSTGFSLSDDRASFFVDLWALVW